jgi:hypothetical protein
MRALCLGLVVLVPLSALAADADSDVGKTVQVPYRLTDTKHVLVRARINGKGPFNFIIDTGSPVLFVSAVACKKAGVEAAEDGWAGVDRFELEGGLVAGKVQCRPGDPAQLEGMNKLGLAGSELHGVIGYNFLARYRIEYDLTKDKLPWTRLDYDPPLPKIGKGKLTGGADSMAGIVQVAANLLGNGDVNREPKYRGTVGIELEKKDGAVVVSAVLKDSPAATAGIEVGDRLTKAQGKEIKEPADLLKRAARLLPDETLELTVRRGEETRSISVRLGRGF